MRSPFPPLTVFRTLCALCLWLAAAPLRADAPALTAQPDRSVYACGETVRWRIAARPPIEKLEYRLRPGGQELPTWCPLALQNGEAALATPAGDQPGWLLLELRATDARGATVAQCGGVLADPTRIAPAGPRPDDFDAFWDAQLAELARVPLHPVVTAGEAGRPDVDYAVVQLDNIRGTHVQAQLARPKQEGRRPALIIFQWAGVYGLQKDWVLGRAAAGWLTLNVHPHDLPIDRPEAFYAALAQGELGNYPHIGNDAREASYFLRMYLGCVRAVDFIVQCPEWDGRTIVVMGASQGGLQALVAAALDRRITAALAEVPAGGDQLGPDVGRLAAYPTQLNQAWDRDLAKVRSASRYYDLVHFAPRIGCPTLVGVGLIDTVVPPPSVYALFNQLSSAKEIVPLPLADHRDGHEAFTARAEAWLQALREGRPPPLPHHD